MAVGLDLTFSGRLRPAIPCGAERFRCRFSVGGVPVLRPVAALPLEEVEAPEPRGFARRVRDGLVDAPDTPALKEDVVAFRVVGVGIAAQKP